MLHRTHSLSLICFIFFSCSLSSKSSATRIIRQTPGPPPSSPTLTFNPPARVITCNPSTFSWDYSGPDLRMSLYVTNFGVPQLDPPSSLLPAPSPTSTAPLGAVSVFFALSQFEGLAPIRDTNFTWSSFALGRGWYVLKAELRAANYTAQGAPFFVEEPSNTTCSVLRPPRPVSSASPRFHLITDKIGMLVGIAGLGYLIDLIGH